MELLSRSGGRERFYKVVANVELQHSSGESSLPSCMLRVRLFLRCLDDGFHSE
jgi:hypothetical protein